MGPAARAGKNTKTIEVKRFFMPTQQNLKKGGSVPQPAPLALADRFEVPQNDTKGGVALSQVGEMWLQADGRPVRFTARQTFLSDRPRFQWRAAMRLLGVLPVTVVDALGDDGGILSVRALGCLPLVSVSGDRALDLGELQRYLAEVIWNPDALLRNSNLVWRSLDERLIEVSCAAATAQHAVHFHLDRDGDIAEITAAMRPRQERGTSVERPWFGRCGTYRRLGGRRIPTEAEVGWRLDGHDLVYWRGAIKQWTPVG